MNKILEKTMEVLAVVGGINWAIAPLKFDVVRGLGALIPIPYLTEVLYVAAGVSTVVIVGPMLFKK